jgi:two-component system, chemotaxis family, sensor kinase Cph1
MKDSESQITILNCENEPVHYIGKIQSFGFLIVTDRKFKIIQYSDNIQGFLDSLHFSTGLHIDHLISDAELLSQINYKVEQGESFTTLILIENKSFRLYAHLSGENVILEFEPEIDATDKNEYYLKLNSIINKFQSISKLQEFLNSVTAEIKKLTQYDRVMVYKFDEGWNGEVVAEAKNNHMDSFLGLMFPSSDIPKQARDIFYKNWIRVIHQVDYTPSELIPVLETPVNLSKSFLRSVSPIHLEYLKNMQIGASMTISLKINNKLWGLIACHHTNEKFSNYELRTVCELLGQICSYQINLLTEIEDKTHYSNLHQVESDLIKKLNSEWYIINGLLKCQTEILELTASKGAALIFEREIELVGETPGKKQVKELCNFLINHSEDIFYTDELISIYPEAFEYSQIASGILVISLPGNNYDKIIFFRPEYIQMINWAGNPNKATFIEGETHRLSPRKSFEKWSEKVKNKSLPWTNTDLLAAFNLRSNIIDTEIQAAQKIRQVNIDLKLQLASKTNEIKQLQEIIEFLKKRQ